MVYWIPAVLVYFYWWINGPDPGLEDARTRSVDPISLASCLSVMIDL